MSCCGCAGKGSNVVLIPLPPAVARAIDRAVDGREAGPIRRNTAEARMDRILDPAPQQFAAGIRFGDTWGLNGTYGQVGTTSRVVMQMGKQKIECTETITRREPVDLHGIPKGERVVHFDREIVGEGMWNAVRDRLTEAGPQTTLWQSESEYWFSGLLMRLVGPFDARRLLQAVATAHAGLQGVRRAGKDVRDAKG